MPTRCRTTGRAPRQGRRPPQGQRGNRRETADTPLRSLETESHCTIRNMTPPGVACGAPRPEAEGARPAAPSRVADMPKQTRNGTAKEAGPGRESRAERSAGNRPEAAAPVKGARPPTIDFFMESLILAQNERWQRG